MKVLVMAAGGIGGYYGGLMSRKGHEVTFVARGPHMRAMRENGLQVKSIDDEFQIMPVHVVDDPGVVGAPDLVLFSVKTFDTEQAVRSLRANVRSDTAVVTFQNGVESGERIRSLLERGHVVSAPTQIESFIAAPGKIEQRSNFRVVTFGESDLSSIPAVKALADVFRQGSFQVNVVPDIRKAVWLKFLRLAPVAGFATLARATPYELLQSEGAREVLEFSMREILAVGGAEDVLLDEQDLASAMEWALALKPGIKPSMQKDIERGNRLEIDALSGAVVRLGKLHNISTPVHQTIFVGLKPEDDRNKELKSPTRR
jgi:2-dehydropantoate 2-reductase